MPAQYYTLVTDIGLAKLANALALGLPVTLTHFAVGDGGGAAYDPVQSAKTLKREVYRAPINAISTDPAAPTWLTVEAVIPATVGGWTVREAGVFDADGDLIAIAKYPESVKPALDSGVGKDLYCRLILEHANVSAVTLKIDPSIVLATRKFVGDAVAAGIAEHKAAEGAHPDATTTTKGFVELATTAETKAGTSASLAVTPKGLADTLADLETAPQFDASKRAATTAFVQRALGSMRGLASANVSASLTLGEVGKVFAFYGSTPNQTITLPDLMAIAVGSGFWLVNQAAVPVQVAAAAGQMINVNTLAGVATSASMTLSPGDAINITSNASAANPTWNVIGIAAKNSFPASLAAAAGYQKLPSGLLVQWGVSASIAGSGGQGTITFPTTFPAACFAISLVPTFYNGASGSTPSWVTLVTSTNFRIVNQNAAAGTFLWLAIGA